MMEKRPLVWLSAANTNTGVQKELEKNWSLTSFSFDQSVPLLTAVPDRARVGVLEFPEQAGANMHWLEGWLEALGLTYWVAISPRRPASGAHPANLIARYCSDFHTQPVDYTRLNTVLGHLWGMASILDTTNSPAQHDYGDLALQGRSQAIRHTLSLLRRFSATLEPVLINGESSTGKDAAARFVHANSIRATGPLIFINCAALPATLTQSELFGYEKGAFTSALCSHQGRLEQANGGSLVFSGINELHLEQQSALLRFLQEGEIERVGGNTRIRVDGRIITTTTQPLPELVSLGLFRRDVYFRLGSLEVTLPPLKNRREDIAQLAHSLLETTFPDAERKRLSKGAVQSLVNHSWPGNLQELQNRLRRGALLSDRSVIEASDLGLRPPAPDTDQPSNLSLKAFRDEADQQALMCSLRLANNNLSEAARLLKISRASLYRLLDKYNPHPPTGHSFKQKPDPTGDSI
ncbi:sigma 54-interacting transcriptional regulator [Marinobacter sp.]|uniref:sigma 54-interacting transcriptional regulator n=1 Tax=Marinobacter sp. TaxID=50741 RepID=UPI003564131A